jgi:hypothetical protein
LECDQLGQSGMWRGNSRCFGWGVHSLITQEWREPIPVYRNDAQFGGEMFLSSANKW